MTIAAAVALMAVGRSAQAQLSMSGTINDPSQGTTSGGSAILSIAWSVDQAAAGDPYIYTYALSTVPGALLQSFTITGLDTTGLAFILVGTPGTVATFGTTADSVYFDWTETATSETVSFSSALPPGTFPFGVEDDPQTWNYSVVAPAAVPEASTVMAGALMLLPLSIGAIRAVRKDRTA